MKDLLVVLQEAKNAIQQTNDISSLEQQRVYYLGKKGIITEILKSIGELSVEERPKAGQKINELKDAILELLQQRRSVLEELELNRALQNETIDITLPSRGQTSGTLHPVSQAKARIEYLFSKMGFEIVEGPEIEDEYHNFSALNIPDHHPARELHDTFYFENKLLLRTHTSPVQIRAMKERKPPFRLIATGRVYRCDSDLTHTPMFHQLEGIVVGEDISFAHLKGTLIEFLQNFFEKEIEIRFRASYFPFTEPSAEVDMTCVQCMGKGCRICKNTGWLEILGCGMIHPNVLKAVDIDPEFYSGFAFGLGIDRLAMLYFGINDLRMMFENDLRFLEQF